MRRVRPLFAMAMLVNLTACGQDSLPGHTADSGLDDAAAISMGKPGGLCFPNDTCFPGAVCQQGHCVGQNAEAGSGDAGLIVDKAGSKDKTASREKNVDLARPPEKSVAPDFSQTADKGQSTDKAPIVDGTPAKDTKPDPCATVSCNNPPPPACFGSSLRTYSNGTCYAGTCSYPYSETFCPGGCSNGACQAPTCLGQTCNTPPSSACINTSVLQTYAPQGVCKTGVCDYQKTPITCSLGCLNGSCIPGSWQAITPPIGIIGSDYESQNIALDPANQAHVVGCKSALMHAYWTPAGWVVDTVDNVSNCSFDFLITSTGQVVIAYYDPVNKDLRVARSQPNGKYTIELVDSVGDVGRNPAVALHNGGLVIAYNDLSKLTLKLAKEAVGSWTSWSGPTGIELGKWGNQISLLVDAQQNLHLLTGDSTPWQYYKNYSYYYRTVPVVYAKRSSTGTWVQTMLGTKGGIVPKSRGLSFDPSGQLQAIWIEVPESSSYPTLRPLMSSVLGPGGWTSKFLFHTNTSDERSAAIFAAGGQLGLVYINKVTTPYTIFTTDYMQKDPATGAWSLFHSEKAFFKDVAVGKDGKARLLVNGYAGPQIIVPP